MLKKLIPSSIRVELRFLQQKINGLLSGQNSLLVKKSGKVVEYPKQLCLSQQIKFNRYTENKIHNLKLASSYINNLSIDQGKIFSFWNLIPRPTAKNGFKEGRNLIGAELSLDYGGGLCQLSGILYHLSLMSGLTIIERHPHSKDIYTEQTRYTPLGSDATVVYGYKDLKLKNSLSQPLSFQIRVEQDNITAYLCAFEPIQEQQILFKSRDEGKLNVSRVYKIIDNIPILISKHDYEKLYPD